MSGMIGSYQWTKLVTSRQPRSGNYQTYANGVDLLSSFVNMSVGVALVFLLLVHFWSPTTDNSPALVLVTILAAAAF